MSSDPTIACNLIILKVEREVKFISVQNKKHIPHAIRIE